MTKRDITIRSGEGEGVGTIEPFAGTRSARAIRSRLTRERCGGDRWAYVSIGGRRVEDEDIDRFLADWGVGDYVCAGEPGSTDYDQGRILEITGDRALVAWDGGACKTDIALSDLRAGHEDAWYVDPDTGATRPDVG